MGEDREGVERGQQSLDGLLPDAGSSDAGVGGEPRRSRTAYQPVVGKEILQPTFLVFDLDPGAPANIVQCCQVGVWLRDIFAKLGLQSFAKTSGSKGLQVYVPLKPTVTYDETKPFAHELARMLERQHPRTGRLRHEEGAADGKDTGRLEPERRPQNDGLRVFLAREGTADGLHASEVVRGGELPEEGRPHVLAFDSDAVLARADKFGDLFEPVLKLKQKMPPLAALQKLQDETAPAAVRAVSTSRQKSATSSCNGENKIPHRWQEESHHPQTRLKFAQFSC